jgi:hypothetical protein
MDPVAGIPDGGWKREDSGNGKGILTDKKMARLGLFREKNKHTKDTSIL